MAELEALALGIVASTPALVCVIAPDGCIVLLNPALERATGWRSQDVVGCSFYDVLAAPHEAALAREFVEDAVRTGAAPPQEGVWMDRWGGQRLVAMQNAVVRDAEGRVVGVACVGVDVTSARQEEARLRRRAETDALTGLRNRLALLPALARALADAGSPGTGVLFCDLDRFKQANDTYGHDLGDRLLVAVARRLEAVAGEQALVTRLGGDEFVVLLPRARTADVERVQRAVEQALDVPFPTEHGDVPLGVSVGTGLGRYGDDPERLLVLADRAMYEVKLRRCWTGLEGSSVR